MKSILAFVFLFALISTASADKDSKKIMPKKSEQMEKIEVLNRNNQYKVVSEANTLIVAPSTNLPALDPRVADSCTSVCAGNTLFCICEDDDGNGYSYVCGSCEGRPMIQHWIDGKLVLTLPKPGDIDPLPLQYKKPDFTK